MQHIIYQAALESLGDEVLVATHMAQTVVGLGFEVQRALRRIHLRVLLLLIHSCYFCMPLTYTYIHIQKTA